MRSLKRILFFVFTSIFIFSCSTMRNNRNEISILNKNSIDKNADIVLYLEEEDLHLGESISRALKDEGFNVIESNGNSVNTNTKKYYKITYNFEKAFTTWSFHVIMKIVDINLYNENDELLLKYNWKVRYNRANSVSAIGKEFVNHIVKMK